MEIQSKHRLWLFKRMNVVSIADIKCINTIETRMNNVLVMTCPIVYQHMQYTFKTTTAEKDVMSPKLVSQSDLNFSFALFSYIWTTACHVDYTSESFTNQCHSPINAAEIFSLYSVPILVTRLYIHVYIMIVCACRRYKNSGHVSSTPWEWEVFLEAMSL